MKKKALSLILAIMMIVSLFEKNARGAISIDKYAQGSTFSFAIQCYMKDRGIVGGLNNDNHIQALELKPGDKIILTPEIFGQVSSNSTLRIDFTNNYEDVTCNKKIIHLDKSERFEIVALTEQNTTCFITSPTNPLVFTQFSLVIRDPNRSDPNKWLSRKYLLEEKTNAFKAIDKFVQMADPDYFMTDEYNHYCFLKNDKDLPVYKKMKDIALKETQGCKTDYEKIKRIARYITEEIDYTVGDEVDKSDPETDMYKDDPYRYIYRVLFNTKHTVCGGFSSITRAMLTSIGIPCMILGTPASMYECGHAFNAAYDGDNKRWIYFDTTWGDETRYVDDNEWNAFEKHFDMSAETLASLNYHEIDEIEGIKCAGKGGYYTFSYIPPETGRAEVFNWADTEHYWKLEYKTTDGKKNTECYSINDHIVNNISYDCKSCALLDLSEVYYPLLVTSKDIEDYQKQLRYYDETTYNILFGGLLDNNLSNLSAKIIFPKALVFLGKGYFSYDSKLKEADLSRTNIVSIEENTFLSCNKLTKVTFPESVTNISKSSFRDCQKVQSINLNSVKTIGTKAFQNDKKLKEIYLSGNLTNTGKNAFKGINKKATFYIAATKKDFSRVKKLIKKSGGIGKKIKFKRITPSNQTTPVYQPIPEADNQNRYEVTRADDDYNYGVNTVGVSYISPVEAGKEVIVKVTNETVSSFV